jgi:hypothetical protein
VSDLERELETMRASVAGRDRELAERDRKLAEQDQKLTEQDAVLAQRAAAFVESLRELNRQRVLVADLQRKADVLSGRLVDMEGAYRSIRNVARDSLFWKLSRKMRRTVRRLDRLGGVSNLARDSDAIANSGLFDSVWYLKTYPDVAAAGVDPIEHYLVQGASEGRHPGPSFDAQHYVLRNPEAADQNPLLHCIRTAYGVWEDDMANRPLTPADSSVGRLVRSFSERSNETQVVVMGIGVSVWHKSTPPI